MWYIDDDGALNLGKLLEALQAFFRENSEHWLKLFQYQEAGPQLLLQAFLQRVLNGGGRSGREYGLGRLLLRPTSFGRRSESEPGTTLQLHRCTSV